MVENRGSMAGAACVLAAMRYIAEIKVIFDYLYLYLKLHRFRIGFYCTVMYVVHRCR